MKFKTYVLFFILFGVLTDIVFSLTLMRDASLAWKLAFCIPTLVSGLCLPFVGMGIRYADSLHVFSYFMFIFSLPKTIATLLWLVIPASIAMYVGIGVSIFFLVFIFIVSRRLVVKETKLGFKDLPAAFDGIRICHIADFHVGSYGKVSPYIHAVVKTIMSRTPDVVFFSGDLVNFEALEAFPYKKALSALKAPMGVFSVLGNHDFLLHGPHDEEGRKEDMVKLIDFEKSLGWKILRNAHTFIEKSGESIAVVGVDNITANPYFPSVGGDLKKALEGLADGFFKILLSHDPTHWRMEVLPDTDIDLTLSGHTHGLKYKLAGKPSHWRLHESSGVYTEGNQVLNVTAGLGSAFAFRLGGFPRIDMITLTKTY